MATRFYLPSTGAAPVSTTIGPIWDYAGSYASHAMSTTKSNSAFATITGTEASGSSSTDVLLKQYISDALPAGNVGGTFSFVATCLESNTAADMFVQVRISIVSSDGVTTRGELYGGQTLTTASATSTDPNYEMSAGFASRYLSGIALSTVTAQAGDRLVVEIGARAANTSAISRSVQMQFGDPTATADFTLVSTDLTQKCPWIEFSQNVFAGPSTVTGGQATETDTGRAGSVIVPQTVVGGLAVATNVALAGVVVAGALVAGGQATESDSGRAGSIITGTAIPGGQATETDTARAGSVSAGARVVGGQALEVDSSAAGSVRQVVTGGMASETDSSAPGSTITYIVGGQAAETDDAIAGTVIAPITGDVIAGGVAVEYDVARPGSVRGGAYATVRGNRVGGLDITGTLPLDFTPAVAPVPASFAGKRRISATAISSLSTAGTVANYGVVTRHKNRKRERLVIGGKDATHIFGVPADVTYQLVEPLLYGPGSVKFPGIKTPFREVGEGALKWLRKGATVRVQLVDSDDNVTDTLYRGLVLAWDIQGTDLTVQLGGEAQGRAALEHKPLPVYSSPRSAVGRRVYNLIRGLGLPFNPFLGPDSPSQSIPRLGGMFVLDAIEYVCRATQRRDGTQFSVMLGAGGAYRFEAKDRTTVHATVYVDGTRVVPNLRSDIVDEPNRVFANATTPQGRRLTGIVASGIVQGTPPPFAGNMSEGDTGGQVPVLIDRLQGFDLLDEAQRTGFDDEVTEAVEDLQEAAGLAQTGVVNEATWNALFDLDVTGYSLRLAHRDPAAQKSAVRRWDTTPTGAIIKPNPGFKRGVPKVDAVLDMGSNVSARQRKRWARAELAAGDLPNWSGTLEVTTGAVIAGNHHWGDPLTNDDLMDTRLVKPGMNIMVRGFQGDDAGILFHVSGVDGAPASQISRTFLVDTRARDTLHVWDAVQRRRDEDRWRKGRRASSELKDVVGEWDGAGGGKLRNAVDIPAETWVVFGVPAGDEGTISRFRIATNSNAEFVAAFFGGPLVPKALEQYLARKIPGPLLEAGTDAWDDRDINQKLKDNGLLGVWGEHLDPGGYEPRAKSRGGELTGLLADDAGIAYRTARFPVLYVAVWADRDTTIPAGRIMWNQLEPGA